MRRLPKRATAQPASGIVRIDPSTKASRITLSAEEDRWRLSLKTGIWAAHTPKPAPSTVNKIEVAHRAVRGEAIDRSQKHCGACSPPNSAGKWERLRTQPISPTVCFRNTVYESCGHFIYLLDRA